MFLQAQQPNLEKDTPERLRKKGEPARLLELLPRVRRNEYRAAIVQVLLTRTPLPVAEAAGQLGASYNTGSWDGTQCRPSKRRSTRSGPALS